MTARVLVVDDVLANVRLLEAKLVAEYFEVITAMNGVDAIESVNRAKPDIVLLDVMMPGIDCVEVCKRIKGNQQTQHIPVVMVTALDQPEDRVRGLAAGADDFLTKPVNDVALFCRVKSLVRLKMLTDELRNRLLDGGTAKFVGPSPADIDAQPGKILVVGDRESVVNRIRSAIGQQHEIVVVEDPSATLAVAVDQGERYELFVVDLDLEGVDAMRLCSQLKSLDHTRQTPILIISDPDGQQRLLRALDMGVNDYLLRPIDKEELIARVNTQLRRCRYAEHLRHSVRATIEMAVTDALTGLYNRRYLETHLGQLIDHAANRGKPLSVLTVDVDFFKSINDTHGHSAGDRVLQELAGRIRASTRNVDIACRTGGEEFVIVLPSTEVHVAQRIGERMRKVMSAKRFNAGVEGGLGITVSIGVAGLRPGEDRTETLLKRADGALYQAKRDGRNRVVVAAAA